MIAFDAHRDGKRFVIHADEILTAFLDSKRQFVSPTVAYEVSGEDLPKN